MCEKIVYKIKNQLINLPFTVKSIWIYFKFLYNMDQYLGIKSRR